jgi:hypothetical protein
LKANCREPRNTVFPIDRTKAKTINRTNHRSNLPHSPSESYPLPRESVKTSPLSTSGRSPTSTEPVGLPHNAEASQLAKDLTSVSVVETALQNYATDSLLQKFLPAFLVQGITSRHSKAAKEQATHRQTRGLRMISFGAFDICQKAPYSIFNYLWPRNVTQTLIFEDFVDFIDEIFGKLDGYVARHRSFTIGAVCLEDI